MKHFLFLLCLPLLAQSPQPLTNRLSLQAGDVTICSVSPLGVVHINTGMERQCRDAAINVIDAPRTDLGAVKVLLLEVFKRESIKEKEHQKSVTK